MNRMFISIIMVTLCVPAFCADAMSAVATGNPQQMLENLVIDHRNDLGAVGVGVMVSRDGEVIASVVAGERKHRSGAPLTADDKWHIGSIAKSFTATLIARLVERGVLNWDTTISDVLGDSMEIRESWRQITIEQLLTHTSGASSRFRPPLSFLFRTHTEGEERSAARASLITRFMKNDPLAPAGSTFMYSNGGVLIAGVMAEKLTGRSWEDLIRQEIFLPLGIRSGGFGVPTGGTGEPGQPRGHKSLLGIITSVNSDSTLVIGPAGSIHMSLPDLLIYANDHLAGESGNGKLLRPETYQKLHTPILDNYAFGWVVNPHEEWADGPIIWHNGSNGHWDALLALLPESRTVISITSNDGRFASSDRLTQPLLEKTIRLLYSQKASVEQVSDDN